MKQQLLRTTLALSFAVAMLLPITAQADMTQFVDTEQRGSLPSVEVISDPQILFHVSNTSTETMKFSVPELGINQMILPQSRETVHVDVSKSPKRKLAYHLMDSNGRQVSSGTIDNQSRFFSDISLMNIINYSTAYNAESKPQPRYYDRNIRGYW